MSAIAPTGRPNILDAFAAMDAEANRQDPGRPARLAEEKRQKEIERANKRVEILHRYGSVEAAIAGSPMQQRLAAAVKPFRRQVMYQFFNGRHLTDSLDGWTGMLSHGTKASDRVRGAVENASPMPETIVDAVTEWRLWRERDEELELIHDNFDANTQLPLECQLREKLVRDLLEFGLRATCLADIIARQRYAVEMVQAGGDGCAEAILADLEHLATRGASAPGRDLAAPEVRCLLDFHRGIQSHLEGLRPKPHGAIAFHETRAAMFSDMLAASDPAAEGAP